METSNDSNREKKKKRKIKDEDPDSPSPKKKKRKSRKDDSAVATLPDSSLNTDESQARVSDDSQGTTKKGKKKKEDKAPAEDLNVDMPAAGGDSREDHADPEQPKDKTSRKRVKKDKSTKTDSHKDKASKKTRKGQKDPHEAHDGDLPNPSSDASLSDKSRSGTLSPSTDFRHRHSSY